MNTQRRQKPEQAVAGFGRVGSGVRLTEGGYLPWVWTPKDSKNLSRRWLDLGVSAVVWGVQGGYLPQVRTAEDGKSS